MILQALNQYYDRLAADPEQDVAPFGFRSQYVSFCIVLTPDGQLAHIDDLRMQTESGLRPVQIVLPYLKTRTSGEWANFLWDNTSYALGADEKEPSPERLSRFRDLHDTLHQHCPHRYLEVICRFLHSWNPDKALGLAEWDHISGANVVFRLQGEVSYFHDEPLLKKAWVEHLQTELDVTPGVSLLSGRPAKIALTHPLIQPVQGCNQSRGAMVAFNKDKTAFTSYGMHGNLNAPLTLDEAFQYTTALNKLLGDRNRRRQLGDATTVFWTESPTPSEELIPEFLDAGRNDQEDAELLSRIRSFLDRLRAGKADDLSDELGSPQTPYYLLGLSPNAARISVRFWMTGSLGELAARLSRHVKDLDIIGLDDRPPTLQELLRETAAPKGGYPDSSKIPAPLETAMIQAVLRNLDYPQAFFAGIIRRIRCEQFVSFDKRKDWRRAMAVRASAIKACLIRNTGKEINVALDSDRPEPAYHLGRWFALLERIQKDALGERLNSTIKDRFFSAASATPGAVFPRLIRLSQHHLNGIESTGLRVVREKAVQEVASRVDAFPRQLALHEQGLFDLGYYHQVQDLYTRKNGNGEDNNTQKESE